MHELGFDINQALPWFATEDRPGFKLVRVSPAAADQWAAALGVPFRRCYITDELIAERRAATGAPVEAIVGAVLPDPGSTMSGDFGEILTLFYNVAAAGPAVPINPKKWRLKQDRTKPAPLSDVLNFILPHWPNASADDELICSEVKAKATGGDSEPISAAIADCHKDRTSRLMRTLQWLKERALRENLGAVTIAQLERFINAVDYPAAAKKFKAVAVICGSFVDGELANAPAAAHADFSLVVISVPELKRRYTEVFAAAKVAPV